MTREKFIYALDSLDIDIIEDFVITDNALKKKKRTGKRKYIGLAALAACLLIASFSLPMIVNTFTPSHATAPVTVRYNSFEELSAALPYNIFYKALESENANTTRISMSYESDKEGNAITSEPLQLLIRQTYEYETHTDTVDFYIIFGRTNVDESYIGGYEEQGLTKEINGTTVHYSMIDDGAKHSHAKFVRDGNLYVVDVLSDGEEYVLDKYLKKVLRAEMPDDFYVEFRICSRDYIYTYSTKNRIVMKNDIGAAFELSEETLEKIYEKAEECNMLISSRIIRRYPMLSRRGPFYIVVAYANGRQVISYAEDFVGDDEAFYKAAPEFASFVDFMKEILYSTPEFTKISRNAPHF